MNSIRFHADDRDEEFDLASGGGWGLFARWADSLPNSETLKALVKDGTVKNTLELRNDLGKALDDHAPDDPNVRDIAEQLYDHIDFGSPDEIATVDPDNYESFAEGVNYFDDIYHGPEPPSREGWVAAGTGPRGGKMWKHVGSQSSGEETGHDETKQLISKSIKESVLSPEQAKYYESEAHSVIGKFNAVAHKRFKEGCNKITFKSDLDALNDGLVEAVPILEEWRKKGGIAAGVYLGKKKEVMIDGEAPNYREGDKQREPKQTYAHEFMHAIDGPEREISSDKEWLNAWQQEIVGPKRLSKYAGTKPSEGLAEFGRFIYAHASPEEGNKRFPQCFAVLKKYGVV